MATLKQKLQTMLELQNKIEDLENRMRQELDKLEEEKSAMIREFNAPVIQSLVDSISAFLAKELGTSEETALDISDIDISFDTGEYDDLNMGGAVGEIVHDVNELKFDEDGRVLIGFQHYCGGHEWGSHDESITQRPSILCLIADYLSNNYDIPLNVSPSSLVFSGNSDYYQERIEKTDERCDEFGLISIDKSRS